jgi:hypothetical protein
MPVNTRLQVRRGTASGWTSANPTLYAGEIGFETDTGRIKIGDGTTVWTSLDYNVVPPTGFLAGSGLSVSVAADGSSVTYSLSDPTIQVSDITDLTASATELNYLDGSVPGTGVAGKAVVLDSNLSITNIGNISTTGTITVGGNLIVNGSTTTVNSTVTTIDDPILTLGGDTAPSSDDNKDRGIEFRYHNGSSAKLGFFGYDDSTGKFIFIPDATNSSEVFSGTKGEVDANIDWSNVLNKPDPIVSVNLTGSVSGSGNTTLTDLGNGTISISTSLANSGITLGSTTVYLGGSSSSIVGLSSISGTSSGSPTTLYNCIIDGGTP